LLARSEGRLGPPAFAEKKMAQLDLHNLTDQDLAGRWVAVESGAVLVDYDTELDLLCQRVAAAGLKRLTIYKYEGNDSPGDVVYRRARGTA
jgi:hypothetical protein